jgi:hypothetical protein
VRILGLLAVPGTISAVAWPVERLVRDVLAHRRWRKEFELRCKLLGLDSGSQHSKAVRARHARRRESR